ncbi:hypothetical protein V6N12_047222 [Hibiscus sabdariffa]|uniref:Uncharacterized protein n=1 Tax=Hibiscus sabdariffa TaxID=183260 RepID=A0ABR2DA93_9ROSI
MERRNPEKGREEGKYSEAEKSNPGERNIARKIGEAEERIPVAGKTVDGKDSKSTKADFERVGESSKNKAEKNIEMANVQRSRRFFPEYSLKADRIRINVSRENGVEKATGLQRSPEEPKQLGFSDESDRTWDKRWRSAKVETDDLKDSESTSDVKSLKGGMVGEDRCRSDTELDAIKAMCVEREYDECFHREENGLRNRSIGEEWLGGSSKEEMVDCGNRNGVGNIENGVEFGMGEEIEEEGCNVVSPKLLEKGSGLLDSSLARESSRADIRISPMPVVNLIKSGEEPVGEIHRTWASTLFISGQEVLDSEVERIGVEGRTQNECQLGPENLVDNLVEALNLARYGQTSKMAVLQLKTDKASSEVGQLAWANRLNECLNAEKGISTSDDEVAQKGENEKDFFC